jgi:hypothetical protein
MIIIDMDKLEYGNEGLYLLNGVPYTGLAREYEDKKLISEITFNKGVESGIHRGWYLSGQLNWEGYNKDGYAHGFYREWYENGSLAEESLVDHAIPLLIRKWNMNGRMIKFFINCQFLNDSEYLQIQFLAFLHKISENDNLISLGLQNCTGIIDKVFPGIGNMIYLQELNLSGTGIDDSYLSFLLPLKKLKKMNLFQTNVSESGMEMLRKRLDNCVIVK